MKARTCLAGWLAFLAAVEVPEILKAFDATQPLNGFASNLADSPGGAERRLWCVFLALIVLARVAALAAPCSPAVAAHCAAVHVLEFVYLAVEARINSFRS
jgi:hypothetical protein